MSDGSEVSAGCFAEETIAAFVEGALDASQRDIDEHMARCDDCRRLVAQVAQSLTAEQAEAEEPSVPLPSSVSIPPPGAAIGRYALVELIGAGGTGVIYRAHDPQLRRDVALKLLRPDVTGGAASAPARLLREAQAMARLAHPNVVSVHDAGVFDGRVFLAMELVDGQTLKRWLRSESRSVSEIVAMFVATGRGLEAAHVAGLVHRDFKPTNVLVGNDGRPRVLDFGLARASTHEVPTRAVVDAEMSRQHAGSVSIEQTVTATGALIGTPAYMAPEQFAGEPTDARTDQFSFCVALYEAVHGQRPFGGESLEEIARAVLNGKLRAAPAGNVPAAIDDALRRGLERAPAKRFPSMSALLAALEEKPARADARKVGSKLLLGALTAAVIGAVGVIYAQPAPEHRSVGRAFAAAREPTVQRAVRAASPAVSREPSESPPEDKPISERMRKTRMEPTAEPAVPPPPPAPVASGDPELIEDPWGER